MTVYPLADLVSPVNTAELAVVLDVEPTDPRLSGVLLAASDMLIQHMQRDLEPRPWRMVAQEVKPQERQLVYKRKLQQWIEIPYGALSIDAVLDSNDEPLDFEADLRSIPARIWVDTQELHTVEYTAGFAEVPAAVKEAIKALAAFLYEHLGQCEAHDALKRSGAADMVKRYRIQRL